MEDGLKIIVGYDGSTHSVKALKEAVSIASRFKGSITVFTGLIYPPADVNRKINDLHDNKEMRELSELEKEVRSLVPSEVSYNFDHDEVYDIADSILDRARSEGYGLIVIGSKGLTDTESLLLGSVSHKIVNHAHVDVLVVK